MKRTNLQFIATPAPTTSADPPPRTTSRTVHNMTSTTNTCTTALSIQPTMENELLLLSALCESEAHVQRIEAHAFELQASNILNKAYADRLKKQLAAKEEKKGKKKSIKLVGNGLPRLLTADEFYELAKEKEKEVYEEARDKEMCKEAWQLYTAAIASWKVANEKRKEDAAEARAKNKRVNDAFKKKRQRRSEAKSWELVTNRHLFQSQKQFHGQS